MSRMFAKEFGLPPAETHDVTVDRDLRVPMPDGVELLADRYAPRDAVTPPLVLVRSPYGRRFPWGLMYGRLFAERGFQVVIQSCRGTFGSGGVFSPFGPAERTDGQATVDWLREQPWYPGSFGTAGPCYLGYSQWAIAAGPQPEHTAMAVQVAASDFHSAVYGGGAFALENMVSWIDLFTRQEGRLNALRAQWARHPWSGSRIRRITGRLPLDDLDRRSSGRTIPYFQDWLAHPGADDPYWTDRDLTTAVRSTSAAVCLIGGWHDFMLPAQLRDYALLRARGVEPHLTIGPWRHTDDDAIAEGVRTSLAWLREALRDGPREAGARIFVTGADEWRDLPEWPPPAEPHRWHLHADGGFAPAPPEHSAPDHFTYDPAHPTPNLAGPVGQSGRARVDNRSLESRADVLTYTGAPLDRDLEVAGVARAELYLRPDRPFADVFARLCEVEPSGRSVNICDGLLRLNPGRPDPASDGVTRAAFDLWPIAHRFRRGHRIRLVVSGGAHPRYARNPGTGESPATATRLVPTRHEVLHDPGHPSAVVLPVASPDGAPGRSGGR